MINDWFETVGEEVYISSKRFQEKIVSGNIVIHGPSQSTADGELDFAKSLRCKKWISPAQQWVDRSRTPWPNYTLIISAVHNGVLFVPKGCKYSPNEDLQ